MKKAIIVVFLFLICVSAFAKGGNVHVNGYTRRDGTYVQPHYRTAPNSVRTDNWSYSGNVNPYTGKVGTKTDGSYNYVNQSNIIYFPPVTSNLPPPPPSLYIQQ